MLLLLPPPLPALQPHSVCLPPPPGQVERVITIMQNPRQYKIPDWFLNRQKDVKDGKYSQVSPSAGREARPPQGVRAGGPGPRRGWGAEGLAQLWGGGRRRGPKRAGLREPKV